MKKNKKFKTTYKTRKGVSKRNKKSKTFKKLSKSENLHIEKELDILGKIKKEINSLETEKRDDKKSLKKIMEKYYEEEKVMLIDTLNKKCEEKGLKKLRSNASLKSCIEIFENI